MRNIIYKLIYIFKKEWHKILLLLVVYCFVSGSYIKIANEFNLSLWEFILLGITDRYYLMFGLLPVYLVITYDLFHIRSYENIIRYKKLVTYFYKESVPFMIFTVISSVIHILSSMIIGLLFKLPFNSTFTVNILGNEDLYKAIMSFNGVFKDPIVAILGSCMYGIAGLIFINLIIRYLAMFLKTRKVVIITMGAYIISILAFQKGTNKFLDYISLHNYFIIIDIIGKPIVTYLLIMTIVMGYLVIALNKRWECENL